MCICLKRQRPRRLATLFEMLRFIKWNFGLRYQMCMSQETRRLKNITLFEVLCIIKFWNFAPRYLWQVWTITLYYILHACLKSRKEEQRWSAILYLIPQYHTECQAVECFKQFFVYLFYNIHRCCIWAIDGWLAHWPICELFVHTCSVWLAPLHIYYHNCHSPHAGLDQCILFINGLLLSFCHGKYTFSSWDGFIIQAMKVAQVHGNKVEVQWTL